VLKDQSKEKPACTSQYMPLHDKAGQHVTYSVEYAHDPAQTPVWWWLCWRSGSAL